jgi:cyclopropane-fatty-acyl-phospholipid synthase
METHPIHADAMTVARTASRDERVFFDLASPALKDKPLGFICEDRRYLFGSDQDRTVIRINDPVAFRKILTQGNLGLAECYMDQKVEVLQGSLENLLIALARSNIEKLILDKPLNALKLSGIYLRNMIRGRYRNIRSHYDMGVDLFESFLDETMAYSCGYATDDGDSISDLQINKYNRICRKLRLQPGDRLLDIGCGFGGLLIHAARHFGVRGTGITISHDQYHQGRANVEAKGLSKQVDIQFASHKEISGTYDKIVSVGMFEHLKYHDYPVFFRNLKGALAENGMGLVHTISCNASKNRHDPFIQRYIFPGSRTPKLSELSYFLEKNNLPIIDVENIVRHYAPTMRRWNENFQKNYARLDHSRYDARFKRMMDYYFACGVAASLATDGAVFQVLFGNSYTMHVPYQRV